MGNHGAAARIPHFLMAAFLLFAFRDFDGALFGFHGGFGFTRGNLSGRAPFLPRGPGGVAHLLCDGSAIERLNGLPHFLRTAPRDGGLARGGANRG